MHLSFGLGTYNQGCGAVVEMTLLRLRSSIFLSMAPAPGPEFLVFVSVAPDPELFFSRHGSGFCLFRYINIFICLGVPQGEWKKNISSTQNKRINQTYLSSLIR